MSAKILTVGDVARILGVVPRTVCKWCDTGRLVYYRIPGSTHRRILREHLEKFCTENDLPLESLERVSVK